MGPDGLRQGPGCSSTHNLSAALQAWPMGYAILGYDKSGSLGPGIDEGSKINYPCKLCDFVGSRRQLYCAPEIVRLAQL